MTIREIPANRIRAVAPSGVMAAHWAAVGLVACIVACSSTTSNTNIIEANCGPGTILVDASCVPADVGEADAQPSDTADDAASGEDSASTDSSPTDATSPDADASTDGGSDTSDDADAGSSCMGLDYNCSTTCGGPDATCSFCGDSLAIDMTSRTRVVVRVPALTAASTECAKVCKVAPAAGLAFLVSVRPEEQATAAIRATTTPGDWSLTSTACHTTSHSPQCRVTITTFSIWRYFDATTTSTTAAWQDFVFEKVAAG